MMSTKTRGKPARHSHVDRQPVNDVILALIYVKCQGFHATFYIHMLLHIEFTNQTGDQWGYVAMEFSFCCCSYWTSNSPRWYGIISLHQIRNIQQPVWL
jgi:hypothetical protein